VIKEKEKVELNRCMVNDAQKLMEKLLGVLASCVSFDGS